MIIPKDDFLEIIRSNKYLYITKDGLDFFAIESESFNDVELSVINIKYNPANEYLGRCIYFSKNLLKEIEKLDDDIEISDFFENENKHILKINDITIETASTIYRGK